MTTLLHVIYPAATYVVGGTPGAVVTMCTSGGNNIKSTFESVIIRLQTGIPPFNVEEITVLGPGDDFGVNVLAVTKITDRCTGDITYVAEYLPDALALSVCCGVLVPPESCGAPTGLGIDGYWNYVNVELYWTYVIGQTYTVYTRLVGTETWILAGTGLTNNWIDLLNVPAGEYEWRVRANCSGWSYGPNFSIELPSFYYGYSENPFGDGTGGTEDKTTFAYQFTGTYTPGGPLYCKFVGMPENVFVAVKYPIAESVKTKWKNTVSNYGDIPDSVFEDVSNDGTNNYITSRIELTLNNNYYTIFS